MNTVIEVIAIIIVCLAAFVYFRSLGKHLDKQSKNYKE